MLPWLHQIYYQQSPMQFKVSLQQQSLREYDGVELNLNEDIQMSTF